LVVKKIGVNTMKLNIVQNNLKRDIFYRVDLKKTWSIFSFGKNTPTDHSKTNRTLFFIGLIPDLQKICSAKKICQKEKNVYLQKK